MVVPSGRQIVELGDPSLTNDKPCVVVASEDVRTADNLEIRYDFERDGWSIRQRLVTAVKGDDWPEVAFITAWGREDPLKYRSHLKGENDE